MVICPPLFGGNGLRGGIIIMSKLNPTVCQQLDERVNPVDISEPLYSAYSFMSDLR